MAEVRRLLLVSVIEYSLSIIVFLIGMYVDDILLMLVGAIFCLVITIVALVIQIVNKFIW